MSTDSSEDHIPRSGSFYEDNGFDEHVLQAGPSFPKSRILQKLPVATP